MPLINCSRWARQWPLPACECTERDAIVKFRPLFSEFLRRKSILTPHFKLPQLIQLGRIPYSFGIRRTFKQGQGCHHRSEEHTSELQSLMRISYAVFCLKNKKQNKLTNITSNYTNLTQITI